MRLQRPTPWSLQRPEDLRALAIGSAIGIGNFFVVPSLILYAGGLPLLLTHFLGLLLLGSTLLLAEFMASRWLLRPYIAAFVAISPWLRILAWTSVFAVLCVAPPYILLLGRLLVLAVETLSAGGFVSSLLRSEIRGSLGVSFLGGASILGIAFLVILRAPAHLARVLRLLFTLALSTWTAVALHTLRIWGPRRLAQSLLYWDAARVDGSAFMQMAGFSLFTLSAGFGILFVFVYYASQVPLEDAERATARSDFWKRPGALLRVSAWVIACDFGASLLALIIVAPFALSSNPTLRPSSEQLFLEWLPQVLVRDSAGWLWVALLMLGLLAAGLASAISILEFLVFNLERGLHWTRRSAALHVLVLGLLLLALPLIPLIDHGLTHLGADILLPISALGLCYLAGWRMPQRAQRQILGRGLLLDPILKLWRFSVRYLTPLFLVFYLFRQFF